MKISVIVTNWNGRKLLQKNLADIIDASPQASEIILADDASTDDSLSYVSELQKTYSKLRLISHSQNVGFGQNTNHAVNLSSGDYVALLNSDINPQPGYLSPAIANFKNPKVFGVGFSEIGHENYAKIQFKDGYIQHRPEISASTHISGWVSGGSSIISKNIFQKLNGFDIAYAPFYGEDLDIGYRAWKSGYQCLWEPASKVHHRHEATMSKFSKRLLEYVKERNRLLNVWRNISDPNLISQTKLALIGRVITGPNYLKIIMAAKKQMNKCPKPTVFPKLTDTEIFNLFK